TLKCVRRISFVRSGALMGDLLSGKKQNATGDSIAISTVPWARCGRGTTSACGQMSNGRSMALHPSFELLKRVTMPHRQVITNCVATITTESKSRILVCCRTSLVADWAEHYSRMQSKRHGEPALKWNAYGSTRARLIIRARYAITRRAAW